MTGAMAVVCVVSLISDVTIDSEQVDRLVYKNIRISENGNQTTASFTVVNNGAKSQTVCTPVILAKKANGRDRKVMSINKTSSVIPVMKPGESYQLRFTFPVTGADRIILYGGGFRFSAKQHIYRY